MNWLQDPRNRPVLIGFAAALGVILLATALLRRRPQDRPAPPAPAPQAQLNPELARRYPKEPTISVFIHEKNKRVEMPLDEYLIGVLGAEATPNMPLEGLKAQAIAARTITLFNKEDPQAPSRIYDQADACTSTQHFQAYAPEKITDAIHQAVRETRGQIATYQGELIYAAFSSNAGGRTATAAEAFGDGVQEKPYLKSTESPIATDSPKDEQNWSLTIGLSELYRAFGAQPSGGVEVVERGPSGRIVRIKIGNRTVSGMQLRATLGGMRLRSTLVTDIKTQGSKVTFSGKGWGHGAGLDQWGAHALAQKGWRAQQILAHYYQGTAVHQLYP